MAGQMEHLELPVAGLDNVPFRYEPRRLDGRALVRFWIVAEEGNGFDHESGRVDSGAAKRGNLFRAALRKEEASLTGSRELLGLGLVHEDFAIGEFRVGADMIDMCVRRENESWPGGQTIDDRPQRCYTHPAVDQNIALPAQNQETVRSDPPVAAGLRDPKEVRRELYHLEPWVLSRQARAWRFIYISGGLGHCTTLRGGGTRDGCRAKSQLEGDGHEQNDGGDDGRDEAWRA